MRVTAFFCLLMTFPVFSQLTEVTNFGSNPGNLTMYEYVPTNPQPNTAVVLVMHGCGQLAEDFANETGWNDLADQYGFYVVHAGQSLVNNGSKCFNWFSPFDYERNAGEAQSLAQMVDYMHNNYNTDNNRSYVCGLSAGGSMTSVMMAAYPDKFRKGGIWAGVPYRYLTSGSNNKTPQEWGDYVRNAVPNYTGDYPTLFVCQGTDDLVVDSINETRLVQQWTDVHGTDQTSDYTNASFMGNTDVTQNIYKSANLQDTIVITYTISGMAHGIAVDPGMNIMQGGQTSLGAFDVDFFSTFWMADFFDLIPKNVTTVEEQITEDISLSKMNGHLMIKSDLDESLIIHVYSFSGQLILADSFYRNTSVSLTGFDSNLFVVSVSNNNGEPLFTRVVNK